MSEIHDFTGLIGYTEEPLKCRYCGSTRAYYILNVHTKYGEDSIYEMDCKDCIMDNWVKRSDLKLTLVKANQK